jgi:glutathione S-transferase
MHDAHEYEQNNALDLWVATDHDARMKLYFSPLACSLASRIVVYELGLPVDFVEIDPQTKRILAVGSDYKNVTPLGLVPALVLGDGTLVTENAAILTYLADRPGAVQLAPSTRLGRTFLHQWLGFISTELHKGFVPLLDKHAPPEVKSYAASKLAPRLAHADAHLSKQPYLLDEPSVADAYLFAVLNWTAVTKIAITDYPALQAFHTRMFDRPAVRRAFAEERDLYVAEIRRAG